MDIILKQELINYSRKENFTTSFNLAIKYIDYAIFVQKGIRLEIIALSKIYFDESRGYLLAGDLKNKDKILP